MISAHAGSRQAVRFGSRGSALALVQTELAVARLRAFHPDWDAEIRIISTQGDLDKRSPLSEIGGRGVFTSALESAVLAGDVDAAVHSAKDLPTSLHPDAPIVAYPERADPRDVLVSRHGLSLEHLPRNPVIGTSSRRRAVQITRLRPDARIVELRGNIDTRLRKAAEGELDAIVLAGAGLQRMGWQDRVSQTFSVEELTPSPGQGALAIQACRGSETAVALARMDDSAVSAPVIIERGFLGAIGAGCAYPVGAHATLVADGYRLLAMVADESGDRMVCADEKLAVGEEIGHAAEIAARLRAEVDPERRLRMWNGSAGGCNDLAGVRVVVTRPRRQAEPLLAALRRRGADPVLLPTIRIEPVADTSTLDARLREAEGGAFHWFVFTSANAVEVVAARLAALGLQNGPLKTIGVAAVGPSTAAAARAAGLTVRLVARTATAERLATDMMQQSGPEARVLYPRSAIGREALPAALRGAGMDVVTVDVYHTLPEEEIDPGALEQVRRGDIDLIAFSSPSTVRGFLDLFGADGHSVSAVPVVCIGPVTAKAAKEAGFSEVATANSAGAEGMADAVSRFWRMRTISAKRTSESRVTRAAAGPQPFGRSGD